MESISPDNDELLYTLQVIKNHTEIVVNEIAKNNLQATNCPEKSMQGGGLQTVSMTGLYDTVYPPVTPAVEGFLYGGTYLFVGAPKVGKSFFMGQPAYHVTMGFPLWNYPVRKGQYYTLLWKMIMQGFSGGYPSCLAWSVQTIYSLQHRYSYSSDYEIVAKLKTFSDKYGVCLLVVHYTRKLESEDSFDMISGTNGLLGAANGAFIMHKGKQ